MQRFPLLNQCSKFLFGAVAFGALIHSADVYAALTLTQVNGYSNSIYNSVGGLNTPVVIDDDSVESLRGQTIVTKAPSTGEAGWSLEYLVLKYFDYTNTRTLGPSDVWEVTIVEWQPSADADDSSFWDNGTVADPLSGFSNATVILQDSGSFAVDTDFTRTDHMKLTLETPVFMEAEKAYGIYFTNKNSKGESFQVSGVQGSSSDEGGMLLQLVGQPPVMIADTYIGLNLHGAGSAAPDDRDIAPRFKLAGDLELPLNAVSYADIHVTEFDAHNDGQTLVGYTVTNTNNELFSSQPAIDNTGVLTFTPSVDVFGEATVSVYATDSGATNNVSLIKTFTITVTDRPAQVVYVDASRPAEADLQDGKTWETAFEDLQDALAAAVELDEIWVAKGVYYPDQAAAGVASVSEGSRSARFELLENVPVYGGFAGGETHLDERLPKVNVTILSGDIDENDTKVNGVVLDDPANNIMGSNVYQVVRASGTENTTLDGFTITAGSGGAAGYLGGGLLRSCIIQGNTGYSAGAINANSTTLTLIDCELYGNTNYNVGAISLYNVDLTMIGCRVQGNVSTGTGDYGSGGLSLAGGQAVLINCLIAGNVGTRVGGVMLTSGDNEGGSASLSLENSTITANYASSQVSETAGGVSALSDAITLSVTNSIVYGNLSAVHTDAHGIDTQVASLVGGYNPGGSNIDGTDVANDPSFVTPLIASGVESTTGDFRLLDDSPVLSAGQVSGLGVDSVDLDGDGDVSEALPYDIDQNARVIGTLDLGAFEYVETYSELDLYRGSIGIDTDGSEDYADSSGNGIENVFYFAFDLGDPLSNEVSYADPDAGEPGLPTATVDTATDRYQLTYVRPKNVAAGITVSVECSSDALEWIDVQELTGDAVIQETNVQTLGDTYELVTIEFSVGDEATFYRTRVAVD